MPAEETISITLTAEASRAIRASVEAGDYASASDAVADAVRVWTRQRQAPAAEGLAALDATIRRSLDGPDVDLGEVERRVKALIAKAAEERGT